MERDEVAGRASSPDLRLGAGEARSATGERDRRRGPAAAEILQAASRSIDSPGVGGLDSAHALTTLAALPSAHAVLLVSDASQEYTEPEIQFLRHAMRISPNVACVLTKTDLYPQWRQIEELDRGAPRDARSRHHRVPGLVAGAAARRSSLRTASSTPSPASPRSSRTSATTSLGRAELLQRRPPPHDLLSTIEHVRLACDSELSALQNPEKTPRRSIAQLEAREEPRRRAPRTVLALADHAQRRRRRPHRRHGARPARPAAHDPARGGGARSTRAIPGRSGTSSPSGSSSGCRRPSPTPSSGPHERSRWLSEKVARHFTEDEVALPIIDVDDTRGVLDPVGDVATLDSGRLGAGEKIYIGVRGLVRRRADGRPAHRHRSACPLINPLSLAGGRW